MTGCAVALPCQVEKAAVLAQIARWQVSHRVRCSLQHAVNLYGRSAPLRAVVRVHEQPLRRQVSHVTRQHMQGGQTCLQRAFAALPCISQTPDI